MRSQAPRIVIPSRSSSRRCDKDPRTARNGVRVPPRTNASVIAEPACERSGRPDAVVDLAESNRSNAKSGLPGSLAGDVHGEHSDGLVNRVGFCSVVHRSAEKCRDSDRFEPVIWNTAAGYFSAKGRALPRLDKPGGELRRVEVRSDVTGATLAGTHTRSERRIPPAENADDLGPYRFTRTAQLQR